MRTPWCLPSTPRSRTRSAPAVRHPGHLRRARTCHSARDGATVTVFDEFHPPYWETIPPISFTQTAPVVPKFPTVPASIGPTGSVAVMTREPAEHPPPSSGGGGGPVSTGPVSWGAASTGGGLVSAGDFASPGGGLASAGEVPSAGGAPPSVIGPASTGGGPLPSCVDSASGVPMGASALVPVSGGLALDWSFIDPTSLDEPSPGGVEVIDDVSLAGSPGSATQPPSQSEAVTAGAITVNANSARARCRARRRALPTRWTVRESLSLFMALASGPSIGDRSMGP